MAELREGPKDFANVLAQVQIFGVENLLFCKLKMTEDGVQEEEYVVATEEVTDAATTAIFANDSETLDIDN